MLANHPNVLGRNQTASSIGIGDVDGPASSTDKAIARFSGTTGKLIQDGTVTLSDTDGTFTQTTTNGNLILLPNGTGVVNAAGPTADGSIVITTQGNSNQNTFLRLTETTLATGYLGGYMKFEGLNNLLQIGYHNNNTTTTADDVPVITIVRGSTNVLLAGLTTNGTGALQFPAGTTSAGGITFSDINFFRVSSTQVNLLSGTTSNSLFIYQTGGTTGIAFQVSNGNGFVDTTAAGASLTFRSGAQTQALSLDASQQETLGSSATGGATTITRMRKAVTAIADAAATAVLTVTIPNAAHSAGLTVKLCGSLGAGGAIGANEASQTICYDVGITRTAGVNAVAVISSSGFSSGSVAVAGAATITVAAALSAISGAVGASNTFTVNATITRGSGASTNHTLLLYAEVRNANANGVTVA